MRNILRISRLFATVAILIVPTLGLAPSQPVVVTTEGTLAGVHRDGLSEFFGIPYAAPPVGNLRWQPPQQPAKWNGTWEAP